ncbi:MAG: aminotransferase class IV [Cyclobacteriaceae bacterium]|nr:aminotransferase class IV [Cyclobacteriaceae bacterium]
MNPLKYIVNTELKDVADAVVHISDVALLRGYGIFDFFRLQDKAPLYIDQHIDRFYRSAQLLRLYPSIKKEELKQLIYEMLSVNKMPGSGIRMVLTGGSSHNGFDPGAPQLLVTQEVLHFAPPTVYENGTGLMLLEHQRELSEIKSINYLSAIYHWPSLSTYNASDFLYKHQGKILEATRSNIFFVMDDESIYTPAKDILSGINRRAIINMALNNFEVNEGSVLLAMLPRIKEAFITGTTKKILPVVRIDDHVLGDGSPGKITRKLMEDYEKVLTLRKEEEGPAW